MSEASERRARWARAREASWGLVDQALSSLSNFALTLVAARSLSARDLGGFALAFAAYLTFLGLARAVATEPLTVRFTGAEEHDWRFAAARSTGAAITVGAIGAALMVLVGAFWRGPAGLTFLAIAPFLPGLLLQDAWRFAFFARESGARAAANDAVWALALGLGIVPLLAAGDRAAWQFALVWGTSGSLAGLVGIWQAGLIPRPAQSRVWLQEHRDLIPRFASEFASLFASGQLALYAIGAVAGLAAVGAIRAAQVLLGPLNVVFMGTSLFVVPEAVRRARRDPSSLPAVGLRLSLALVGAVLAWTSIVALLPPHLGVSILGRGWRAGRGLLLPMATTMAGLGMVAGAATMLRGLADARRSLTARLLHAALVVGLATSGALLGGASGAAWGLALAPLCAAAIWWRAAFASLRQARARTEVAMRAGDPVDPEAPPPG